MLVSRLWLQRYFDTELPAAEKLAEALTFHAFEVDSVNKQGKDEILDIAVSPNRGHDCLSHRGVAKELSVIFKIPLTHDPLKEKPDLSQTTNDVRVLIDDATLCPRYIAGIVNNVKVRPSPQWLKERLESVGQRSINNVVDATNFVMLDIGQPLHAFDTKELMSRDQIHVISVRRARPGEGLSALDQKDYVLTDSMLAIVDANADTPIGIAGVKGGSAAGVTERTTDIILESANFNGPSVRKTAQGLKLRTDASARFEQGLSPELAGYGIRAAVNLILELAGGELGGFVDVYPTPPSETRITISLKKINAVLGASLSSAEAADAFTRLTLTYQEKNGVFEVVVPSLRLDLQIAEDLIEEVGRIVGYDRIPAAALEAFDKTPQVTQSFAAAEAAREELVNQGYSEVYTSVFAEKGEQAVLNKVDSVKPFLRASLLPGLTEAIEKNKQHRELLGLKEIKLFEVGPVWKGGKEITILATAGENEKTVEKPLEIGNTTQQDLSLASTARYTPFSRYPYVVRDIAMWVPANIKEEDVLKVIDEASGDLAHKVWLFDRFEKTGKTSLAYRLVFQSFERTLTEVEVNNVMQKVSEKLNTMGFEIR